MLGCLRYQTRPPDETIAFVSGVAIPIFDTLCEDFADVSFSLVEDQRDWGHAKRAQGLAAATGDVVGWFNDDDDYTADYLAKMLAVIDAGSDVAFCDWSTFPQGCDFRLGSSTSGNFVVRTEVARRAGWTGRVYEADGHFIDSIRGLTGAIVRVPEVLYFHNAA